MEFSYPREILMMMRTHPNSQKNTVSTLQSVSNFCNDWKEKEINPTGLERGSALQLKSHQLCKKLCLVRMVDHSNGERFELTSWK